MERAGCSLTPSVKTAAPRNEQGKKKIYWSAETRSVNQEMDGEVCLFPHLVILPERPVEPTGGGGAVMDAAGGKTPFFSRGEHVSGGDAHRGSR